MADTDHIILVDEHDNPIGTEDKLAAHKRGALHRCFSVVIYNSKGEMLLQKRADGKYHSGGLWTNACCSHQLPGESTPDAIKRRLPEELGFVCDVEPITTFIYSAELDNGITEHELDHLYRGVYDGEIQPDPSEVSQVKWVDQKKLAQDVQEHPEIYTAWLPHILKHI